MIPALQNAVLCAKDPVEYYKMMWNSYQTEVPKSTSLDVLEFVKCLIEARGLKVPLLSPASPAVPAVGTPLPPPPKPEMAFDLDLNDLLFEDTNRSPGLKEALQARVTKGLSDNPNQIKFFWEPFEYDGQMHWIFATWRLNAPGWAWNISGKMDQTIIHKGGPDILVYDGGRAIKDSRDIEGEFLIPVKASAVYGRKMQAKATIFVWLLQFVEGRKLRFWIHEDMDNPKRSTDIGGNELIMTLKKLAAPNPTSLRASLFV